MNENNDMIRDFVIYVFGIVALYFIVYNKHLANCG